MGEGNKKPPSPRFDIDIGVLFEARKSGFNGALKMGHNFFM